MKKIIPICGRSPFLIALLLPLLLLILTLLLAFSSTTNAIHLTITKQNNNNNINADDSLTMPSTSYLTSSETEIIALLSQYNITLRKLLDSSTSDTADLNDNQLLEYFADTLNQFKREYGFVMMDVKTFNLDPEDTEAVAQFQRPHYHMDCEARIYIEGSFTFIIQVNYTVKLRLHLTAGYFVVLPARMRHQVEVSDKCTLRQIRLFMQEIGGGIPIFTE